MLAFYAARAAEQGWPGAKSGAVTVVQRTSSDLRLNPHLRMIVLDGTWCEKGGELAWEGLWHLRTSDVGAVLEGMGAEAPGWPPATMRVDRRTALVLPSADLRPQPMRGSAPVPASASGSRPA